MAAEVLFDVSFTVNSVDLSDHCSALRLGVTWDRVDDTAFGDTLRSSIAGLGDGNVSGTLHQDYASSKTYATLQPLVGGTTSIVIIPDAGANVSATNPQFTVTASINSFDYINARVGELHAFDFDWPLNSGITVATST